MSRRTAQNPIKRYLLLGIRNKNLFRKVKEQESGLQNSSKIFLKKAKLMMTMALHFKVSI
nr:hypothetical protein [Thomasclavelia cocleata]